MTTATHPHPTAPRSGRLATLAAPFRAAGRALMAVAQAGPAVAAIERLSHTSDAELGARGTTRDAEMRRIVGVRYGL